MYARDDWWNQRRYPNPQKTWLITKDTIGSTIFHQTGVNTLPTWPSPKLRQTLQTLPALNHGLSIKQVVSHNTQHADVLRKNLPHQTTLNVPFQQGKGDCIPCITSSLCNHIIKQDAYYGERTKTDINTLMPTLSTVQT